MTSWRAEQAQELSELALPTLGRQRLQTTEADRFPKVPKDLPSGSTFQSFVITTSQSNLKFQASLNYRASKTRR